MILRNRLRNVFINILILTNILCLFSLSPAQTKIEKIDELIQSYIKNGSFNGALLVAEKGMVIYKKAFGYAHFDNRDKIRTDSQFRLASVSKQFTAMAIILLNEKNKLKYDDNIKKYLPSLPYENITIRHILTHTSGLPDYMTLFEKYWDVKNSSSAKRKIATNKDVINMLAEHAPPLLFKPGEKWKYSNTAYVLVASIVEKVSGIKFSNFLQKHIFSLLNMKSSLVYSPIDGQKMNHRTYGYRKDHKKYVFYDFSYLNGIAGDGAIYSTLDDLFLWDQALYTEKLVSKSAIKDAFTPVKLNNGETKEYGFGWTVKNDKHGKTVSHGGSWVGFRTFILRDIKRKNTIILLCNVSPAPEKEVTYLIKDILLEEE